MTSYTIPHVCIIPKSKTYDSSQRYTSVLFEFLPDYLRPMLKCCTLKVRQFPQKGSIPYLQSFYKPSSQYILHLNFIAELLTYYIGSENLKYMVEVSGR